MDVKKVVVKADMSWLKLEQYGGLTMIQFIDKAKKTFGGGRAI
jgi:hypothetical protein